MHPRLHFTLFVSLSFAIHALVIAAILYLVKPALPERPLITPVNIVNLPPQEIRQLPPLRPAPVPPSPPIRERMMPEKPLPPASVPLPKKFGDSDKVTLPKTTPAGGVPDGSEQGNNTRKTGTPTGAIPGTAPLLTQNDIEELARKGMPEKKPGDDSVTLDTDEFKFISYNRWLKVKVESVLRYPELAALSGYQGTLYIQFDIKKDGTLGSVEVLKSSGYKILDDEAVRSITDSAPFQPLPDDWRMEKYSIRAAVLFYLGEGYIR